MTCNCEINTLLLKGCVSTKGEECPSAEPASVTRTFGEGDRLYTAVFSDFAVQSDMSNVFVSNEFGDDRVKRDRYVQKCTQEELLEEIDRKVTAQIKAYWEATLGEVAITGVVKV